MKQFMFCRVCRQNHDKGKGHKYGVKHNQNLAEFLSKARKKIENVRLHLTEAVRLQDEERRREKFWCSFCDQDIDERGSLYVRYV
jgi:ribosomal protein L24E